MTARAGFVLLFWAMPGLAAAAGPGHLFEGNWIWDPAAYLPPPGMPEMTHLVAETMTISTDDGRRYVARTDQLFDAGQRRSYRVDMPEDGVFHDVPVNDGAMTLAISVLPDGARRVVSRMGGGVQVSLCRVTDGGLTLLCRGHDRAADGREGDLVCVYRRDPMSPPAQTSRLSTRAGAPA